jgi:hypothetical protein
MRTSLFLLFCACAATAADNQLTPEEKKAGWHLLFDGASLKGWIDPAKQNIPGNAWAIDHGSLKTVPKPTVREESSDRRNLRRFRADFRLEGRPRRQHGREIPHPGHDIYRRNPTLPQKVRRDGRFASTPRILLTARDT